MSGTWQLAIESSEFSPDPATGIDDVGGIWLEATDNMPGMWETPEPRAFKVQFVGRMARNEGKYGQWGIWPHVVIVDKLISIRKVPWVAPRSGHIQKPKAEQ